MKRLVCITFLGLLGGFFGQGCAGPATPFGAVNRLMPPKFYPDYQARHDCDGLLAHTESCRSIRRGQEGIVSEHADIRESHVDIGFQPARQIWHSMSRFKVSVFSERPIEDPEIVVLYNGTDVSESFLKNVEIDIDLGSHEVTYQFRDLQLPSGLNHDIQIGFRPNLYSSFTYAHYSEPVCSADEPWSVRTTAPFAPEEELLTAIEQNSVAREVNPSLVAGLIAQESGFSPVAVSWAKAVGLTQVTTSADHELRKRHPDWPRNPKIEKSSVAVVKSLIKLGTINSENDWRLHPEMSIAGGIEYFKILEDYWAMERNRQVLIEHGLDGEEDLLEVLLASYNSGAARVKNQIVQRQKDWISSDKLKEARKYVRRIRSFCYHFSREEEV